MNKPTHRVIKDREPNQYRVQEKVKFLWFSYWRSITIERHPSLIATFFSVDSARKRIEELRKEHEEQQEFAKVRKQWLRERKRQLVVY